MLQYVIKMHAENVYGADNKANQNKIILADNTILRTMLLVLIRNNNKYCYNFKRYYIWYNIIHYIPL